MWVTKVVWTLFQQFVEREAGVRQELEKERALRVQLETQLAARQATLEFMGTLVTQMQHERALLTERVLGVQLPAMQVSFEAPPAAPPREPSPLDVARSMPPGVVPMPSAPPREDGPRNPVEKLAEYLAAGGLFEDMGDEAARAAGIARDPATGAALP